MGKAGGTPALCRNGQSPIAHVTRKLSAIAYEHGRLSWATWPRTDYLIA